MAQPEHKSDKQACLLGEFNFWKPTAVCLCNAVDATTTKTVPLTTTAATVIKLCHRRTQTLPASITFSSQAQRSTSYFTKMQSLLEFGITHTGCFNKKHPLMFSSVSPRKMIRFDKKNFQ